MVFSVCCLILNMWWLLVIRLVGVMEWGGNRDLVMWMLCSGSRMEVYFIRKVCWMLILFVI